MLVLADLDASLSVAIASAAVALIGVIVALAAASYAKRSATAADESVRIARDELALAREEHDVFLRELRARARFKLTIRCLQADADNVVRTDASTIYLRIEVRIANEGDKAAGPTTINVLVPASVGLLRWCGPMGEEIPDVRTG